MWVNKPYFFKVILVAELIEPYSELS
jgi:hypothetical protein